MHIDERLEKLTERHEALTQSIELIAKAQLENEKRHAWVVDTLVRLEGNILDHDLQIDKINTQIEKTDTQIAQLTETVNQLARTVDRYIRVRGDGGNGAPQNAG